MPDTVKTRNVFHTMSSLVQFKQQELYKSLWPHADFNILFIISHFKSTVSVYFPVILSSLRLLFYGRVCLCIPL
jgi:hypothetical protein